MSTSDLYDLIVVVIIIVFAIRGYQKGLINQIGALISMIVGALVSVQFAPVLAPHLWGNDNVKYVSAFVILVFVVTLVVWGIINAINAIINNLKLNFWNNQMGALLGIVYGILWTMLLTFVLLIFAVPQAVKNEDGTYIQGTFDKEKSFIMNSKLGPYLTSATLVTIDHLPQVGNCSFYNYLRDILISRAEEIKVQNPDLPHTYIPAINEDEQGADSQKPSLPGFNNSANPRNPDASDSGRPESDYPHNPGNSNPYNRQNEYPQTPSSGDFGWRKLI